MRQRKEIKSVKLQLDQFSRCCDAHLYTALLQGEWIGLRCLDFQHRPELKCCSDRARSLCGCLSTMSDSVSKRTRCQSHGKLLDGSKPLASLSPPRLLCLG